MKAIGYQRALPIDQPEALQDIELPKPQPTRRDVLVAVQAVSMNPVDTKVRASREAADGAWQVLGWDAAGVVQAVGPDVTTFAVGDRVWYAGDLRRPGSNAEFQCVDERLVAKMPDGLSFAGAAAMPLTAITAWEMLFDCWQLNEGDGAGESLLIVGGAGGVGSILIQLAKELTSLTVIATASRPDTVEWVRAMGADHVIDHREPMGPALQALGLQPRYIASLTATAQHLPALIDLAKPRGHIAVIDDPSSLDILPGKLKSLSFHWEFMFARSLFDTADMSAQQTLLTRVAELVDAGQLRTTRRQHLGTINAKNLTAAHALQESGRAIGKIVLEGFGA